MTEDGTERPECWIVNCGADATRELYFPVLGEWRPYCDDHRPVESWDDERPLEPKTDQ